MTSKAATRDTTTDLSGELKLREKGRRTESSSPRRVKASRSVVASPDSTLTASAFEELISYVVHGTWKAGDRIPPERELCQQLGIARTSLREAVKALELIGMLESRVGDGTFVCDRSEFLSRPLLWALTGTDRAELRDIMEARLFLEQDLAGLAAERASNSEIEDIGKTLQDMRNCLATGESPIEADMQFHLAVADAAHNEVMRNAVQLLRNLLRQWLLLKLMIPQVPAKILQQHDAVFRAIKARDVTGARTAMARHLEKSAKLVYQVVRKKEQSQNATERVNA
jgi:GntR family transcriptional regulator, transcriptional repressor for pyruvate dehydrogenase complex